MFRFARALVIFSLTALAPACGASRAADADDTAASELRALASNEIVGALSYGQTSEPIAYESAPTYRAFRFQGTAGDQVEAWVRSDDGDARAWMVTDSFKSVVSSDNADASTLNARLVATLKSTGTYYVVFRDKNLEDATFTVSLAKTNGGGTGGTGDGDSTTVDALGDGDFSERISAGDLHACAVRTDGTVACWGSNAAGRTNPPAGTFRQISAGGGRTCGVRTDGTLACWGYQLLDAEPTPAGMFRQVTVESETACAIRMDGTLACWGKSIHGREKAPGGTFRQISAGPLSVCGVRTDGSLACWGYPWSTSPNSQPPPTGTFRQISLGHAGMCQIKQDSTISCWDSFYQRPLEAPSGTFRQVSVGPSYECGVRTDQTVACWGYPWSPYPNNNYPPPTGTFRQIAASGFGRFACGVRTDGTLACWGENTYGQATPPAGKF